LFRTTDMNARLFVFTVLSLLSVCLCDPTTAPAEALLKRRFPSIASAFTLSICSPAPDGSPRYTIADAPASAAPARIAIAGSDVNALTAGIGHYLEHIAHIHLSWTGDETRNAQDPSQLAKVGTTIEEQASSRWSYYMNTCTHSYSAAWWDWDRWEREIDWMALRGVNLPLAFTGQEYVQRLLFREFGLSEQETLEYFTGPAFLAWFRMGNVQTWAGPLPASWVDAQHDMQVKILARMRELDMTPVLSMFAGHVPSAFRQLYPTANITPAADWGGFPQEDRTWILEVTDPLFNKLAKRYIEIQTEVYGTSHIYNGDVYNEMIPPSSDPAYLAESSRGTINGLLAADPNAIWLMQGWLFVNDREFWKEEQVKAYLSGVPNDKMIILDLFTEGAPVWSSFGGYYGKKWIWCMLHNFGGTPGMWGNLTHMLTQPHLDQVSALGKGMIGVGITMEAIGQNYMMYDAMLQARWRTAPEKNVDSWVQNYAARRYALDKAPKDVADRITKGWVMLRTSVYNSMYHNATRIENRPSFEALPEKFAIVSKGGLIPAIQNGSIKTGNVHDVWETLNLWINDENTRKAMKGVIPFEHDVIDVVTQCLANQFDFFRVDFYHAYKDKDIQKMKDVAQKKQALLEQMDRLLAADHFYLLGKWIEDAKKLATTDAEKVQYEFNARNQLTLWGPDGNINDYARKSWAGLYKDYYAPRWQMFTTAVINAVAQGKEFDQATWDAQEALPFEKKWQNSVTKYASEPSGEDALELAYQLFQQWRI